MLDVEDLLGTVLYLISESLNTYGQNIIVDDGFVV